MKTKKAHRLKAHDLVPHYFGKVAVSTLQDIIYLGSVAIRQMIRRWRYDADQLASSIKNRDEKMAFLKDKTAADISKEAKKYDDPKFVQIGIPADSWDKTPEPLDAESINRKQGTTTFNVCGWCKYRATGLGRYSYMISGSCDFKRDAGIKDEERHFNTPCFLPNASGDMFDEIRFKLANEKLRLIDEKQRTDEKIKLLLSLEKKAEKKPALPDERPHDWFNVDDPVVCYIGKQKERIVPDTFAEGSVIDGYRHHDGGVSVCFAKRVHNNEYLEGRGGGYGMSRPEVMHKWEYEYLLAHPDFADVWIKQGTSDSLPNLNREQFLRDMAKEALTRGYREAWQDFFKRKH